MLSKYINKITASANGLLKFNNRNAQILPSIDNLKVYSISKIRVGDLLANSGKVIEIQEFDECYLIGIQGDSVVSWVPFDKDRTLFVVNKPHLLTF